MIATISLPRQRRLALMFLMMLLLLLTLLSLFQGTTNKLVSAEPTPQPSPATDLALVLSYPNGAKEGKVEIVNRSLFHTYSFSFVNRVAGHSTKPLELLLAPGQRVGVDVQPPSCAALQLRSGVDIFTIWPNGYIVLHLDGFDCYPQAS